MNVTLHRLCLPLAALLALFAFAGCAPKAEPAAPSPVQSAPTAPADPAPTDATPAPDAAADATPAEPPAGGALELRELGYTVTLPAGWARQAVPGADTMLENGPPPALLERRENGKAIALAMIVRMPGGNMPAAELAKVPETMIATSRAALGTGLTVADVTPPAIPGLTNARAATATGPLPAFDLASGQADLVAGMTSDNDILFLTLVSSNDDGRADLDALVASMKPIAATAEAPAAEPAQATPATAQPATAQPAPAATKE